ncbi:MAG: DHHA1 domain-containing protein, partial [Thermoanaerobaculia bacterium]|nr:DHHA1 domain-containing protein [Thermoanaerobaculia bacterium]
NGIGSVAGVERARRAGMRVDITDHHLPGPELPEAEAVVDPNQPADRSGLVHLAGVGVVFLLMVGLRAALREAGRFRARGREEPNLADLLDLVALGTVADVVPLDHANRLLVHQGLRRIRSGRCQPGIAALAEIGGRRLDRLGEDDLGYIVGPRLNAAGRLDDMGLGISCLVADDPSAARGAAQRLDELNRERRSIERRMEEEALETLGELDLESKLAELPAALCIWDADWHQGVVGILASRLKERLHRPVIAFAPGDDGELRGSARSVEAVHIRDAIENVANRRPGLVPRFGGHAMAAGLSLAQDRFDEFRRELEAEVERIYPVDERRGTVRTDGELEAGDIGLDLAREIRQGGPWGRAFPQPRFDGRFEVVGRRVVGGRHLKLQLRPEGGRNVVDAIAFRHGDREWPDGEHTVEAVYRLEVDDYRGVERFQLVVRNLRVV